MAEKYLDLPPSVLVMQPGTLCNLDCEYCYLPDRRRNRLMERDVNLSVAGTAVRWASSGHTVQALWHMGEPLAVGVERMEELWSAWPPGTVHRIQTNGTLINDAWCDLFSRHTVRVSVSSDGPGAMNASRASWSGVPAGNRVDSGLRLLRDRGVPFGLLSVVRVPDPRAAVLLYDYARRTGARSLGILPEEKKGVHKSTGTRSRTEWIAYFQALFMAWRENPSVRLRELESVGNCHRAISSGMSYERLQEIPVEAMPTIAHNGDVTVLSPDLLGQLHHRYGPFTVGNVLTARLEDILDGADRVPWVAEALAGVETCRRTCRYAAVCGGNWPANKYFELGRLDGTETTYCRNLHQAKLEGALLCRTNS
ncbi:radical SAM protein [Streptomyces sp. NPDC001795]|uniref:radical SAM protein n=1 Tax=Streptomyces sp. NPDC001795 TaxID=3154525 RepID=UPI003322216F